MEFNVADLVEAAVDRVPDREAVVCGSDRLTYAQLDARPNRLAHYFARAHLLLERSVDGPFHVGVLLDNVPEFFMLLGAAAWRVRRSRDRGQGECYKRT